MPIARLVSLGVREGEFARDACLGRGARAVAVRQSSGELRGLRHLRGEVVRQSRGRVLESGGGTGLNMTHHADVERLPLTKSQTRSVELRFAKVARLSTWFRDDLDAARGPWLGSARHI